MVKTCDNQRARAHAESDEACRKRRGAAAPAGQGVVARQDVPHWDHLRVRRCRSLFRGKIVCLSSSTKILSVASGTRGRGGPVPIDFCREANASHPSRAGSLRSERGSESSRQHRNRDAVKGRRTLAVVEGGSHKLSSSRLVTGAVSAVQSFSRVYTSVHASKINVWRFRRLDSFCVLVRLRCSNLR